MRPVALENSPTLGDQYIGVVRRQVDRVALANVRQVDAVDQLREFPGQSDLIFIPAELGSGFLSALFAHV